MFKRALVSLALLLAAFVGSSLDVSVGDLRYSIGGETLRHWSLVPASVRWKPACAGPFIRSGGYPCGSAGTYTLTGPATGNINDSLTYTVTPAGTSTATITPADASHGGIFNPTSVAFNGSQGKTFTYSPLQIGSYAITTTNSDSLTNPTGITFTTNTNQAGDGYPGLTGGSWQNNAVTHTTGNSGDPFGGSNAAIVTEDTTTNYHYVFHVFTLTANTNYLLSAFVKRGTGSRNADLSFCESGYSSCVGGTFDLNTCGFLLDTSRGSTNVTHNSRKLTNGWCLLQSGGDVGNFTNIIPAVSLINGTTGNYAGDGSSTILAYGVTMQ